MSKHCVIVEDHLMFLQLVSSMLKVIPGLEVDDAAVTLKEGIEACDRYQPDLLLVDLALPDGPGMDAAKHLLKIRPDAKIIVLSGETSSFVCPEPLRHAVFAILSKSEAFDMVEKVINRYLREHTAAVANEVARNSAGTGELPLSPREREIFLLIGRGLLTKEIGDKLGISPQTVQDHRKRIARKLGTVGSELTKEAFRYYHETMGLKSGQ
jgi:DNA-binding NarL/FixJ family response regulator